MHDAFPGIFRSTRAINGGVCGRGVQDGFAVGPEVRRDVAPASAFIDVKVAYAHQFRNAGWEAGILWTRARSRYPLLRLDAR